MKINRYVAQTTQQRLREARAAVMSPQLAAASAAAPYKAISQVSDAVADTLMKYEERNKRQEAQEDALLEKKISMKRKVAYKNWEDTWRDQPEMQPDGTLTSKAMREDWLQINQQFDQDFSLFNDSDAQKNVREMFDIQSIGYGADTENFISQKREAWSAQTTADLYQAAIETGDFQFANQMAQEQLDKGWITQEQYAARQREISISKIQREVDAEMAGIREAYKVGGITAAEEYRNEAINNPVEDAATQDAIETALNGQVNDFSAAVQRTESMQMVDFTVGKSQLMIDIKSNKAGGKEIEAFIASAMETNNPKIMQKAAGWLQELSLANLSGAKQTLISQSFQEGVARSVATEQTGWITDSAENRKNMDIWVASQVSDDMTPQQRLTNELHWIKTTGIPTQNIANQLKAGSDSKESASLIRAAVIYNALRDDTGVVRVQDGLNEGQRARVIAVANADLFAQGMDDQTRTKYLTGIAEDQQAVMMQLETQPQGVKDQVDLVFRELLAGGDDSDMTEAFESMWSGSFLPWDDDEVFNKTVAKGQFQQYVYNATVGSAGRDKESILASAAMQFQQDFPVTYINGEAELQYGGMGGEQSEEMGNVLFKNYLSGKTIEYVDDENIRQVVNVEDQENIKFREPYHANGKLHYKVYFGESPAFDSATGQRINISVDEKDTMEAQKSTNYAKRAELMDEIDDLAKQLQQSKVWGETVDPALRKEAAQLQRDIPNAIEELKRQIYELGRQ